MDRIPAILVACLVVLALVVVAIRWYTGRHFGAGRNPTSEGFYTEHGQEEPTRSDVPYTGTIPYGSWGAVPWAEMVPSSSALQ